MRIQRGNPKDLRKTSKPDDGWAVHGHNDETEEGRPQADPQPQSQVVQPVRARHRWIYATLETGSLHIFVNYRNICKEFLKKIAED